MIPVIPIPIATDPSMMYHKLQSETNSEKKWLGLKRFSLNSIKISAFIRDQIEVTNSELYCS